MTNEIKKEFTMNDALTMQLEHLREWKVILNPSAYLQLLDKVIARNGEGYKSPYDVCRGNDLTNIVLNLMNN